MLSFLQSLRAASPRIGVAAIAAAMAGAAAASPFFFSTGTVTDQIAIASRPGPASGVNQETESADDFVLDVPTVLTSASFTGLIPTGADVAEVVIEVYRVFPKDSDTTRTPAVPTRTNSPSDVEFEGRDSATAGELSFTTTLLGDFTALNSVDTGIHAFPNQTTGGDGPVTGKEVQFDVAFTDPLVLPADHYFFVPQVLLSDPDQHFLWLSGSRPIDASGTPFAPDLQSWIRNAQLDPDWLRVGTDIVGGSPASTFNGAFSLTGSTVPEPSTPLLVGVGMAVAAVAQRRRKARRQAG